MSAIAGLIDRRVLTTDTAPLVPDCRRPVMRPATESSL